MSQEETPAQPARTCYANSSQVHYSRDDFYIEFKVNSPFGTETLSAVFMSPEAAKVLLRILEVNMKNYEEEHRKIGEPNLVVEESKVVEKEKPMYR